MITVGHKQHYAAGSVDVNSPLASKRMVWLRAILLNLLLVLPATSQLLGQSSHLQQSPSISGTVRDSGGRPLAGVSVALQDPNGKPVETRTKQDGSFALVSPGAKSATLHVRQAGFCPLDLGPLDTTANKYLQFVLLSAGPECHSSVAKPGGGSSKAIELSDEPSFVIAGVTNWAGAGGHGSDSTLPASESLTKKSIELRPADTTHSVSPAPNGKSEAELRAAVTADPNSFSSNHQLGTFYLASGRPQDAIAVLDKALQVKPDNADASYELALAYKQTGQLDRARGQVRRLLTRTDMASAHRLLGDIEELENDPLSAVREYEHATRLDPSEQNYFSWGTELLLHRAVHPAVEILSKGAATYPDSVSMLSALGAALYAGGSVQEGANRVCAASDLQPRNTAPYLFLGTMEKAVHEPLSCAQSKLERFLRSEPENPLASYYYALALWKKARINHDSERLKTIEALLQKAVSLDPHLADAYLQLGMLYSLQGDYGKAVPAFQEAVHANPDLSEAHYQLGQAYQRTGRDQQAKQEFQAYAQSQKANTAAIEQQRREIRQFLVVLRDGSSISSQR